MSGKKEDNVSYSEAELRAMRAAGETGSDWDAAAKLPVPDGSDPDDAKEPVEWATTDLPMPKRKEHISLRIDADVLAFFRRQGRGYQTRINAVLRSYVEHAAVRRKKAASPK
jgi:uncharacterized protein (DUF4415 family)